MSRVKLVKQNTSIFAVFILGIGASNLEFKLFITETSQNQFILNKMLP